MVTSRLLLLTFVLATAGSAGAPTPRGAPVDGGGGGMPFHVDRIGGAFDGRVEEVLQVSSYTYLRVDGQWVVTLKKDITVGARVHVRRFGAKDSFHSAQLARTFDHLVFAMVTQEAT